MSVHYKFKSALEYDTVTFDGLHISVRDLKNAIMQQKRIGKGTDFDLQVTNAQTKEVYEDNDALIPKNTSLLIARIPSSQVKVKTWEGYGGSASPDTKVDDIGPIAKTADLSKLDASEDDKIRAMMSQSTQDYDPSNYLKIRGSNQVGAVPLNYRCFKCHQGGHWIKDCPLSQGAEPMEIKKSTGIPRSFMVPVEGPQVPGAMMTPNGSFAVPVLDHQAYNEKPQPPAPPEEKQPEIPEDLVCSICSDLLTDAVMIPCCGNSFCDECIRSILLESEDHECPDCHDRDISPTTLIPNRFLRNSVANFKNTTGYVKRHVYKPPPTIVEPSELKKDEEPEKVPSSTTPTPTPNKESTPPPVVPQPETEKLVISEADSTETPRTTAKDTTPEDKGSSQQINIPEGPPGVSPKKDESPRAQPITTMANVPRIHGHPRHKSSHDRSPRRHHPHQKSPSYKETINHMEDRPGTPTVDEPGGMENMAPSTNGKGVYQAGMQAYVTPLPGVMAPVGVHPPVGSYRPPMTSYQGPPPNFRMPPPMSNPPPYLPSPYTVPPRPIYDGDRATPYTTNYSPSYRPSRGREYPPRETLRRGRTPPGVIDDPLAAFERMLKEKDERERRAKQRKTRSYSRSSSRSYSRSPVHRRGRSRSPRRRMSRSRSRSFSISRSRSRSFSPSPRGSPPRDYSPRGSPRHKAPPRYRSPIKSPQRGPLPPELYRGSFKRSDRDLDRDRDYHHPPPPHHHRDRRGYSKDRDKDYGTGGRDMRGRGIGGPPPLSSLANDYGHAPYYDAYDRGGGGGGSRKPSQGPPPSSVAPSSAQWNQPSLVGLGPSRKDYPSSSHPYYGTDVGPMHRYHTRDDNPPHHLPPLMQPPPTQQPPPSHLPHIRQYDDIAPPGVEQPPIPGLESTPKYEERYGTPYETDRSIEKYDNYDRAREEKVRDERKRDDRGNYRDERVKERDERTKERDEKLKEREEKSKEEKLKDEKVRDEREEKGRGRDEEYSEGRGVRRSRHSRTPEKAHDNSSKSSKARSPEKYKRRKWDESSESREKRNTHEKDKSRRRDTSDDKKSKEKKKRKEKKESDKKKRKDKKEKKEHEKDKTRKMDEHDSEQEKVSKEDFTELQDKELQRSKETDEKVLSETELADKREEAPETTVYNESGKEKSKELPEVKEDKMKSDLYGDLLNEDVDNTVIQTYGKLTKNDDDDEQQSPIKPKIVSPEKEEEIISSNEQKEIFVEEPKDFDDSERDILEIHTNESDLKPDLELKNEVLAPIPEKSKWEVEEDSVVVLNESSKSDAKSEKSDKSAKVTNEVLKRAENAIFAKAINAIRPIEIKKISVDRAKLYSGERDGKERKVEEYKDTDGRNIQVTIPVNYESDIHPTSTETKPVITSKPRLSVKERLGVKVDDLDNIIQVERNRSRSLSPFSRRANYADRNLGHGERKVQLDERRRRGESSREHQRSSRYDRKDPRRDRNYHRTERSSKRDRDTSRDRSGHARQDRKDSRTPSKKISHERAKSKHKRGSSSSSSASDKKTNEKKKKDKKKEKKREKSKKHHKEEESKDGVNTGEKVEKKEENKEATKASAERRKSMIDEAHFEPDYDLETESEKEEKPKEDTKKRSNSKTPDSLASKKRKLDKRRESSSESSSSSSSEEEKKRKKHKKRKKKKTKKESSSSSSSESESESSVDEKDRKKKKHKKKQKKKKKSKK